MSAILRITFLFTLLLTALLTPFTASGAAASDLYCRQDSWAETMQVSRARFIDWLNDLQNGGNIETGSWYVTKPLKAATFDEPNFPETQPIELEKKFVDGSLLWTLKKEYTDGKPHNLPGKDQHATYLYRKITVSADMTITAEIGSDDGVAVWLNGTKIHANDVPRVVNGGQDKVPFNLKSGENEVLLKIYNRTGGHGFYFSLGPVPLPGLVNAVAADFPVITGRLIHDLGRDKADAWFRERGDAGLELNLLKNVIGDMGEYGSGIQAKLDALVKAESAPGAAAWLQLYQQAWPCREAVRTVENVNLDTVMAAVEDLSRTWGAAYSKGRDYKSLIADCRNQMAIALKMAAAGDPASLKTAQELAAAAREPLMANPLLDFDRLLVVKRRENNPGLPQNWQGNCAIARQGYDNEIASLDWRGGEMETLYRPEKPLFTGDVDLHFDADKLLFSMPGPHGNWQIYEIGIDGNGLRQVTPGTYRGIDNYDPCYLPDDRIIFASTRCVQGIPCVGGGNTVANLCIMNSDGSDIRQLCFDQDHNWCPTVLNNGRVMFTRWEYSDTPHYFSRILFHMNPDGTNQVEYYGSNSYWPNSLFYARPVPGHPTKVVGIVSGHHGVARMGEMVLFDPAASRFEADGAVREIPSQGPIVDAPIVDQLVNNSWPKFLHPWPLSEDYFLVSMKPRSDAPWGIYLVDTFNNLTLIKEIPGYALFEPVPVRVQPKPPVVPDKVNLEEDEALVYLTDVYLGEGMKGVPRGSVKALRIYSVYYTYPQMGGHINIGVEGPWDVHRILGTVPVEEDGSASFKVPANTPIAVQPLDKDGRAIQLMRSWFTAMPGETLSCVGCHEKQNQTPPSQATVASRRAPSKIAQWYGPERGFSFPRDVQPVLDRHCVSCHNGAPGKPDLRAKEKKGWSGFDESYLALHPYVRRPGPESDYHVLTPMEYHASTSELIQKLEKGHHGVKLDKEGWDRLVTWIDLNVPDHGTWGEHKPIPGNFHELRLEMRTKFANRPEDPEVIPETPAYSPPTPAGEEENGVPGAIPAKADQTDLSALPAPPQATGRKMTLEAGGLTMEFVLVPAGEFMMGMEGGVDDMQPVTPVKIASPFWMSVTEVTNGQYAAFDPAHDSGVIDQHHKDHTLPGYPANEPGQPVIRISWREAMDFCRWISEESGKSCRLPDEAEWEWACRAGTDTPLYYGGLDEDFSATANMADVSMSLLAVTGVNPQPINNPNPFQNFLPQDARFDDGQKIVAPAGQYTPNPWGLQDMHGNVAEWTLSQYQPYPWNSDDGRNDPAADGLRVARGGSWRDRPYRCQSAYRFAYQPWQRIFNTGFRVIIPVEEK